MLIILSVLLCVDKGQLKEWISLISSQVCHLPEHLLTLCPGTIIREAAHLQQLSHIWLCDPMDCIPPGSSVHGILQARVLGWVAISSSRGPSQPRDGTCASIYRSPTLQVDSLLLSPMVSPTVRLEASKYGQPEMWVELHLQLRSYQTAASSQGNYNGHQKEHSNKISLLKKSLVLWDDLEEQDGGWGGREDKDGKDIYIHIYIYNTPMLIHFVVQQKLTQHCKEIIHKIICNTASNLIF